MMKAIKNTFLCSTLLLSSSMHAQLLEILSDEILTDIFSYSMPYIFDKKYFSDFLESKRASKVFYCIFEQGKQKDVYHNLMPMIKNLVENRKYSSLYKIERNLSIHTAFGRSFYECFSYLYPLEFSSLNNQDYNQKRKINNKKGKVYNYFKALKGYKFITLCLRASCFYSVIGNKSYDKVDHKTLINLIRNLQQCNPCNMNSNFNRMLWHLLVYAQMKNVRPITQQELFLYVYMNDTFSTKDSLLLNFNSK